MNISYMQFSFIFFYLANHFFAFIHSDILFLHVHWYALYSYTNLYWHKVCTFIMYSAYINLFYILYVERYINRPRFHIWGRIYIFCEICILFLNIKQSTLNIHSFSWNNSNFNFKIIPSQSLPQIAQDVQHVPHL